MKYYYTHDHDECGLIYLDRIDAFKSVKTIASYDVINGKKACLPSHKDSKEVATFYDTIDMYKYSYEWYKDMLEDARDE